MPLFHLGGPAGDAFAAAFGIAAAALLVGGHFLLGWQRNRQQFSLMQSALERGVSNFPKGPPFWLVSLRQGLTTLALGIGLFVVGGAAAWLTRNPAAPPAASIGIPAIATPDTRATLEPAPPRPEEREMETHSPRRPGPPPPPNPALEEWHRVKTINTLGLMALGTGFVLILLGIVRSAFARVERRQAAEELQA